MSTQIDVDALRMHLELLGKGTDVRYRAIDPGKKRNAIKSILSIDRVIDCVRKGYDSYIVVGNGGDTDADITGIPAAFGEWDTGTIEWQTGAWRECGLPEPTFQLFTGNKSIHHAWRFDPPCPPDLWVEIQKRLIAQAGFDPTLKNPSRVLRLAGCPHQKTGELARIISATGYVYDAEDFYNQLDPVPQVVRPLTKDKYGKRTVEEILDALQTIPARPGSGSGTYQRYRNILWGLKAALTEAGDDDPVETAITLMEAHSPDGWNVRQVAESGGEQINAGTFWYWAKEHGYEFPKIDGPDIPKLLDALTQKVDADVADVVDAWELLPAGHTTNAKGIIQHATVKPEELIDLVHASMRSVLWWCEMSGRIFLRDQPYDQTKLVTAYFDFSRRGYAVSKDTARDIVLVAAQKQPRHLLREYLDGCKECLPDKQWENIAEVLLGTGMTEFDSVVLRKWLIFAVARAYKPGCPFGFIHILAGPQHSHKTRFYNTLAGDDWFLGGFTKSRNDTDDLISLHSSWIAEWGELDGGISKHDNAGLKAFVDRKSDSIRRPYAASHEVIKRGFVLCGTTNIDTGFFTDQTGNRRYSVTNIIDRIDSDRIEHLRDQVWATARREYLAGATWHLTPQEDVENNHRNSDLYVDDPWTCKVVEILRADGNRQSYGFLDHRQTYTVQCTQLLAKLEPDTARQHSGHLKRVATILVSLGFQKVRVRASGAGRKFTPLHGFQHRDLPGLLDSMRVQ